MEKRLRSYTGGRDIQVMRDLLYSALLKTNSFQGAEPRERPEEQMEQKEVTLGTVMKEARALDLTWALLTLRALC